MGSISAVHKTGGHNALRGSGPGQKPAFKNAMVVPINEGMRREYEERARRT
jgi:hypothetical protein